MLYYNCYIVFYYKAEEDEMTLKQSDVSTSRSPGSSWLQKPENMLTLCYMMMLMLHHTQCSSQLHTCKVLSTMTTPTHARMKCSYF